MSNSCHNKSIRPLRIAINAEEWWEAFTNGMSERSNDGKYRESQTEECIGDRVWELSTMNVQVWFVFPEFIERRQTRTKRGRGANIIGDRMKCLRQMLRLMNVPCHDVKENPLIECVRMQRGGVVDAVWTENSDAILYGCTQVLKFIRLSDCEKCCPKYQNITRLVREGKLPPGRDIDYHHVRYYKVPEILEVIRFTREELIICALLGATSSAGATILSRKVVELDRSPTNWQRITKCNNAQQLALVQAEIETKLNVEGFDLRKLSCHLTFNKLRAYLQPKWPALVPADTKLKDIKKAWTKPLHEYRLREFCYANFKMSSHDFIQCYGAGILGRKLILADTAARASILKQPRLGVKLAPIQNSSSLVRLQFKPYWGTDISFDLLLDHEESAAQELSTPLFSCEDDTEEGFARALIEPHLSPEQTLEYQAGFTTGVKRRHPESRDPNPRPQKRIPVEVISKLTERAKALFNDLDRMRSLLSDQDSVLVNMTPIVPNVNTTQVAEFPEQVPTSAGDNETSSSPPTASPEQRHLRIPVLGAALNRYLSDSTAPAPPPYEPRRLELATAHILPDIPLVPAVRVAMSTPDPAPKAESALTSSFAVVIPMRGGKESPIIID
ncbi:hypothetical protein H072_6207 [Dactylellina haptotyla CBS 200.50]|uniref:XPG-I domain-containing protein n=1 Tax=Dactylellina haptotyla (strain CBS 200.50) TaxID=1284197 RepID=S8BX51_DACHA|nr:hypothetical protein H072_6207 [Dactylellina haptotyla CBS 200.50]